MLEVDRDEMIWPSTTAKMTRPMFEVQRQTWSEGNKMEKDTCHPSFGPLIGISRHVYWHIYVQSPHTPHYTHIHRERQGGRGREENNSRVGNQTGGPKKEFTSSKSTGVQRVRISCHIAKSFRVHSIGIFMHVLLCMVHVYIKVYVPYIYQHLKCPS